MTINQLLTDVLGGGVLGLLGQGIRITIGLKKLNDDNKVKAAVVYRVNSNGARGLLGGAADQ